MGLIEQASSGSPNTLRGGRRRPGPLLLSSLSIVVSFALRCAAGAASFSGLSSAISWFLTQALRQGSIIIRFRGPRCFALEQQLHPVGHRFFFNDGTRSG